MVTSSALVVVASATAVVVVSIRVVNVVDSGTEITVDDVSLPARLVAVVGRQGPASAPRKLTAKAATARMDRETIVKRNDSKRMEATKETQVE